MKRTEFTPYGSNLGIVRLVRHASDPGLPIGLSRAGIERMVAARTIIDHAITHSLPVYGLTTGLGSQVDKRLSPEEQIDFSRTTIRGRAHAVGSPIARKIVRGAMIVRLNTLMSGASGASPGVAEMLHKCLEADLIPVVGSVGSIGASDLCLGATMGLALIGEGEMWGPDGERMDAGTLLHKAGLSPLIPGPKDGLVLASHAGFGASMAAFGFLSAYRLYHCMQGCAAVTLEAIGNNPSMIELPIMALSQHRDQRETAVQLRELLEGGQFIGGSRPGKVQDPLSIRNVAQVHGSLQMALRESRETINAELNTVTDNPVVDIGNRRAVSSGGFFSSQLLLSMETLSRALDLALVVQVSRISKLLSGRFTGLPSNLVDSQPNRSGLSPLLKIAESLLARCHRQLAPSGIWPSVGADGTEDILSNVFERAESLKKGADMAYSLSAVELLLAVQALELADRDDTAGLHVRELRDSVRSVVGRIGHERSMTRDVETLARMMADGTLSGMDSQGC
ncbi:MAG: aromatic amino acid lyase [Gammaproteobacteria bacterium]|nr:aromatic amino acid lyase [Gammaproteobacteria bacterium]